MSDTTLVELVREAIFSGCVAVGPVILAGFVVATLAGLLQAATGVHEPVVGLVPRLAVMAGVLVFCLPWMIERMADLFRIALAAP